MDRGKEKATHDETEVNQPRLRRRGGRRQRYPSLQEQRKFLWEIPVPSTANRASGWIGLNVDDLSSQESSEDFELGRLSVKPTARLELETPLLRGGSSTAGDTSGLRSMPSIGQGPEAGGSGSVDLNIGQEVSGVIIEEFAGGYYVRMMIGNSEAAFPGVLFKPGSFNPFLEENNMDLTEPPVPNMNSINPALPVVGAGANSPLIGSGAINWEALNVGGQSCAGDRASEVALKEAAAWSMKLPENVPDELVKETIKKVHTKSIGQEPLCVGLHPWPAVDAARQELQDLVRIVEESLALGIVVPAKDDTIKDKPEF